MKETVRLLAGTRFQLSPVNMWLANQLRFRGLPWAAWGGEINKFIKERETESLSPGRLQFLALMKLQSAQYHGEPLCLQSVGGWSSATSSGRLDLRDSPPPARLGLPNKTLPTSDWQPTDTFQASETKWVWNPIKHQNKSKIPTNILRIFWLFPSPLQFVTKMIHASGYTFSKEDKTPKSWELDSGLAIW